MAATPAAGHTLDQTTDTPLKISQRTYMPPEKRRHGLTILSTARSILAAALGVQKDKDRERDFQQGRARDFIIGGILFTVLFIAVLVTIVKVILPT